MLGKGPLFILAGLGCIALPGANILYATYFVDEEKAPTVRQAKHQQEEACVKDSVRIAGVWVGCKAASVGREEKGAPRKLQMNSQRSNRASSGSRFIQVN